MSAEQWQLHGSAAELYERYLVPEVRRQWAVEMRWLDACKRGWFDRRRRRHGRSLGAAVVAGPVTGASR
jgi:hypothetical protein